MAEPRQLKDDEWKTAAIDSQKELLSDSEKAFGELAIHHKISRNALKSVGEALSIPLTSLRNSHPAYEGAKKFWDTVQKAAGKDVVKQVQDARWSMNNFCTKVLWNMPVNLEVGPLYVYEDAGTDFDPNSFPDDEDLGTRKPEPSSVHLETLLNIYWEGFNSEDGLEEGHWNKMAAALENAIKAHGGSKLNESLVEQWLPAGTNSYFKKGLRRYGGFPLCERQFHFRTNLDKNALVAEIAPLARNNDYVFDNPDAEEVFKGITFEILITKATLFHICERHTYRYFNFANRMRPINTFWSGDISANRMKDNLRAAFPAIASVAFPYARSLNATNGETLDGIKAMNVPGNNANFFIICDLQKVADDYFQCTVGTIAPDGADVEAYTQDELTKIGEINRF